MQRDERREHGPVGGSVAKRVSVGLRDRLSHGQSADGALLQRGNRSSRNVYVYTVYIRARGVLVRRYFE